MEEFTVADVYEHAAKIGQDIEKLIRDYGENSVEELMPKIVYTLEQLEGLAERRHKDSSTINDLNAEKERLLIECKSEALMRRQAEEKVEYLENMMNDDTKSMQHTINTLKKENEFLKSEVEELDEEVTSQRDQARPSNIDLMVKMRMALDSQKDEFRELNQENERHKSEIEALNEQTNRLMDMNEKLRIYNSKLQDRLAETIGHKVQAEATLASVKIAKEDENEFEDSGEDMGSEDDNDASIEEEEEVTKADVVGSHGKGDIVEQALLVSSDVKAAKGSMNEGSKGDASKTQGPSAQDLNSKDSTTSSASEDKDGFVFIPGKEESSNEQHKTKAGDNRKSVRGLSLKKRAGKGGNGAQDPSKEENSDKPIKKDPNRPRYTLSEMQQVLEERNKFKERVGVLEDVLAAYVPGPVRSSTLDKKDESFRKRKETGAKKGKETPKKEPKVSGIFGSFWKGSA